MAQGGQVSLDTRGGDDDGVAPALSVVGRLGHLQDVVVVDPDAPDAEDVALGILGDGLRYEDVA